MGQMVTHLLPRTVKETRHPHTLKWFSTVSAVKLYSQVNLSVVVSIIRFSLMYVSFLFPQQQHRQPPGQNTPSLAGSGGQTLHASCLLARQLT